MIIITYLFLLWPGDCTIYKPDITTLWLKEVNFSWIRRVSDNHRHRIHPPSHNFCHHSVHTPEEQVERQKYWQQVLSRPTTMYQFHPPLDHPLSAQKLRIPFHPPSQRHDNEEAVGKYRPNYDIQDPQDRHQVLQPRPGIWSQWCPRLVTLHLSWYGAPLIRSRQQHHQDDRMLEYQWDATLPTRPIITCHEGILIPHTCAWHIIFNYPPRGTLFITFCILPEHYSGSSYHNFLPFLMVTLVPLKVAYIQQERYKD